MSRTRDRNYLGSAKQKATHRRWAISPLGRAAARRARLKLCYGLTLEQYEEQFRRQDGCCAICREPETYRLSRRLSVDHDHSTGALRGLLCNACNRALGYMRDRPDFLQNAAAYVRGEHFHMDLTL